MGVRDGVFPCPPYLTMTPERTRTIAHHHSTTVSLTPSGLRDTHAHRHAYAQKHTHMIIEKAGGSRGSLQ